MVGILDSYQNLSILYHFFSKSRNNSIHNGYSYLLLQDKTLSLQIKLFVQKCIHINNGTQNNILNKDTGIEN